MVYFEIMTLLDITKVFLPATLAFITGIAITPALSHYFYRYKMWKKRDRSLDTNSDAFKQIHKDKVAAELSTPSVGGIVIWASVLISIGVIYLASVIFPSDLSFKLNFLSRSQTLVPLGIFIFGAMLGLVDDALEIHGFSRLTRDSKWYTWMKIACVLLIGLVAGLWFHSKLGISSIAIPFDGRLELGVFFVPFVMFLMLAVFSGGVIDGLDGLSGGVMASIFMAFSAISFGHHQLDMAALCAVIACSTLAFLWFNIPPARFYMGETGMMALTVTLGAIAVMTDSVLILPIAAFPLLLTSLSVILQKASRTLRGGKRVFKVAPLHHHFEAIGWPKYKVTMRYWVISVICAIIGTLISFIS